MSFVSYAQNLEDVMLWRALRHVPQGFYIDVGASHPSADSVTRAFYDLGWRGINIEPAPGVFAELQAERPRDINLNIAIGEQPGQVAFYSIDQGEGLSTLDPALAAVHREAGYSCEQLDVEVRTFASVCARHVAGPIHFLKVDAEGAEQAVLRSADFSQWRPWIVLVEATFPNTQTPTWQDWEPLLLEARYRFAYFDGLNRFYVAEERADGLLAAFAAPPSVFDNYRPAREMQAYAAAEALRARAEALDARCQQTETTLTEARTALAESQAERDQARDAAAAHLKAVADHASALESTRSALDATRQWLEERRLRAEAAEALLATSHGLIERRAADAADLAAARQEISALQAEAGRLFDHSEVLNRSLARHVQALAEAEEGRQHAMAAASQASAHALQVVAGVQHQAAASQAALRRSLSGALADQQQRTAELESRLRQREQDYEARLAQQQQRLHRLEIKLSDMRRSTSWRVTRPIRLVKRILTNNWN